MATSQVRNPRAVAASLLDRLKPDRPLSVLLDEGLAGISPKDTALVKEICFGVLRWWPQLDALSTRLLKRPVRPRDSVVRALIMVGLYQLQHMRVAPHAALAETVEASRALNKPWASGLINAVLRRFQRERETLLAAVSEAACVRYLYPEWLLQVLQEAWPLQWEALVQASIERPPMSLRVNLARSSREGYREQLSGGGIGALNIPLVDSGLVLDQPVSVEDLPGFELGLVSVQDGGAQLAAEMMDLTLGCSILDVCAAPGGKTCHLLESAPEGVSLTAIDVEPRRLQRVRDNLTRLGLSATVQLGDATHPEGEWAQMRYDRILLDVPCSATGVIRRHPDIKLLRQPEQIPLLVETQAQMLRAIWPLLKPGGRMLYTTCSLLAEENQMQIKGFLQDHTDAREGAVNGAWGHSCEPGRQVLPGEHTMDGFYFALLEKR